MLDEWESTRPEVEIPPPGMPPRSRQYTEEQARILTPKSGPGRCQICDGQHSTLNCWARWGIREETPPASPAERKRPREERDEENPRRRGPSAGCYHCGDDHFFSECREQKNCFQCGERHYTFDCPRITWEEEEEEPPREHYGSCWKCGSFEHRVRHCPQGKPRGDKGKGKGRDGDNPPGPRAEEICRYSMSGGTAFRFRRRVHLVSIPCPGMECTSSPRTSLMISSGKTAQTNCPCATTPLPSTTRCATSVVGSIQKMRWKLGNTE